MHEQDKYYIYQQPIPGKAFKVITRKVAGLPTGEYSGYYNPKRDMITLYPTKSPHNMGKILNKHEISIFDRRIVNAYR